MAYTTAAQLNLVYGKDNITKWADANNTLNAAERAARIAWAIESADTYINSRLRRRGYSLPFSPVPIDIRDLSTHLAALRLYGTPRGIVDSEGNADPMQLLKDECDTALDNIISGYTKLDTTMTAVSSPFVVKDTDTFDAATAGIDTYDC